jgi:hypothetical protein
VQLAACPAGGRDLCTSCRGRHLGTSSLDHQARRQSRGVSAEPVGRGSRQPIGRRCPDNGSSRGGW